MVLIWGPIWRGWTTLTGNMGSRGFQNMVQIWWYPGRAIDLRSGPLNKTFARACNRTSYYLNTWFWGPKMGQNRGPIWRSLWRTTWGGWTTLTVNIPSEGGQIEVQNGSKMGSQICRSEVPFCYPDLKSMISKIWHPKSRNHKKCKIVKFVNPKSQHDDFTSMHRIDRIWPKVGISMMSESMARVHSSNPW